MQAAAVHLSQASLPDLLPELPDGEPAEEDEKIDATRVVRELGLSYTPLERTLTDMARSLVELGLAVPAGAAGGSRGRGRGGEEAAGAPAGQQGAGAEPVAA